MRIDFKQYKEAARYAVEINAGYASNLFGIGQCPYVDGERLTERQEAWKYGHQQAQRHLQGDFR